MPEFTDKCFIITGGCGTLGLTTAIHLEALGADVYIVDREASNPTLIAHDNSRHNRIHGLVMDITDENQVYNTFKIISERHAKIDGVINFAAATGELLVKDGSLFTDFENTSLETWNTVLDINITGNFLVAKIAGKYFTQQGSGILINTSSIYGIRGPDHRIYKGEEFSSFAAYSASKAAVHGLTQWLATYWAQKNIRVNTIVPGGIYNNHTDNFREKYSARTPMARMGMPSDIFGVVEFLLSEKSAYITGQQIIVDGGLSTW